MGGPAKRGGAKGGHTTKGKTDDTGFVVDIREVLAKAAVMTGRSVDESQAIGALDRRREVYGDAGAVEPPYDPESLLNYIELTPHVAPNIAAYQTNIEGYGFQAVVCESWMEDLDSEEATEAIRNALQIERWVEEEEAALDAAEKADEDEPDPELDPDAGEPVDEDDDGEITDQEIDDVREQLRVALRREQFLFEAFFKTCCSAMSFIKLRRVTRYDIEAHGWGAWEMLTDGYDRLKRLNYIPGYTVRPLRDEGELVEVTEPDPVTPLSEGREVLVHRRFRRYVQIVGDRKSYYKSPGDPRVISATTGTIYKSVQEMRRPEEDGGEGKDAKEANELIYIPLHDPRSPCPPPRWIGNLLAVLGVREADETNYFYLDSSAIPPGILFVGGGKVPRDMKDRLEQRMTQEFGGSENRHKILVVEAHPMKQKGEERTLMPTMEFESLRSAQQNDATFTNYDERSADRIGASFRLPPMLRGYTPKNLNRATAIAALSFAEEQVFEPEREDIDWVVNKYILPRIGVGLHKFRSNSPPTRSPEEIADLIKVAAPHGGLLPYEIRTLLGDALNRGLAKVEEEWSRWPMPMTLAGIGEGGQVVPEEGDEEQVATMAQLTNQLNQLAKRVEAILTDELRQAGFDMDLSAEFRDVDDLEAEEDDG